MISALQTKPVPSGVGRGEGVACRGGGGLARGGGKVACIAEHETIYCGNP